MSDPTQLNITPWFECNLADPDEQLTSRVRSLASAVEAFSDIAVTTEIGETNDVYRRVIARLRSFWPNTHFLPMLKVNGPCRARIDNAAGWQTVCRVMLEMADLCDSPAVGIDAESLFVAFIQNVRDAGTADPNVMRDGLAPLASSGREIIIYPGHNTQTTEERRTRETALFAAIHAALPQVTLVSLGWDGPGCDASQSPMALSYVNADLATGAKIAPIIYGYLHSRVYWPPELVVPTIAKVAAGTTIEQCDRVFLYGDAWATWMGEWGRLCVEAVRMALLISRLALDDSQAALRESEHELDETKEQVRQQTAELARIGTALKGAQERIDSLCSAWKQAAELMAGATAAK